MPPTKIENAKVSITPPRWKSFWFSLKNFKDLPTTKDHYVETPDFSCNGHQWGLEIYPGGTEDANEGYMSASLYHLSEGSTTATYQVMIIDKFGKKVSKHIKSSITRGSFEGDQGLGCPNFVKRSHILDESQNILQSDGALTVVISIEEDPLTVFVPNNPLLKTIQGMFLDEDSADVCFEVVCSAEAWDNKREQRQVPMAEAKKGLKEKAKASGLFHAHHLILKKCAPMLADLFALDDDNNGRLATVTITDIKPDIFRHLLCCVYGWSVPDEDLATHAKDIIDAADKYSIIHLKLEAEAAYVKSIKITMDNAMDNLLYADAKNCALLKEAVIDFLAENSIEAVEKISFKDVPGYLMKDLLVVIGRNGKKDECDTAAVDELTTLSVSDLRRKLDEMGLDVDGSREAMIETIKDNAADSDDEDNNGDDDE